MALAGFKTIGLINFEAIQTETRSLTYGTPGERGFKNRPPIGTGRRLVISVQHWFRALSNQCAPLLNHCGQQSGVNNVNLFRANYIASLRRKLHRMIHPARSEMGEKIGACRVPCGQDFIAEKLQYGAFLGSIISVKFSGCISAAPRKARLR